MAERFVQRPPDPGSTIFVCGRPRTPLHAIGAPGPRRSLYRRHRTRLYNLTLVSADSHLLELANLSVLPSNLFFFNELGVSYSIS